MNWLVQNEDVTQSWWILKGKDCEISLESRPHYCDRGNFVAKLHATKGGHFHLLGIDGADGWPRYYFDFDRAKAECEAWLVKRGQGLG